MRNTVIFDSVSEILGDEKNRFFGEGYRSVDHEILDFGLDKESIFGQGKVKIEYRGVHSKKGDTELKAHFTTLDMLVLTSYSCEKFVEAFFSCSFKDCWFTKMKISTTKSSTDLTDSVLDFYMNVENMEIYEGGYKVYFTTWASNIKNECTLYTEGDCLDVPLEIPRNQKILLRDTYIGSRLLNPVRSIEDTYIELNCDFLISRININNPEYVNYDIFDMFLCMSQQVQALFYKYDQLQREDTNNLWMREIAYECDKPLKVADTFYQIIRLNRTKLIKKSEDDVWRVGNVNISIMDYPDLKVTAKIAHKIPNKKERLYA